MAHSSQEENQTEEISLSIEETNKLRASLGLPLLKLEPEKDEAAENYMKYQQDQSKKAARKQLAEQIKKEKGQAERNKKLLGKGLAEQDEPDNAMDWVNRMKKQSSKRQKEIEEANQKEKELNEKVNYSAAELKGIRVGHKLDDIADEGDTVLVLKDQHVTEGIIINLEQGDELLNVNLVDLENARKNIENRKGKGYHGYDDDEFLTPGQRRSILSHYDEEKESESFTLGSGGQLNLKALEKKKELVAQNLKKATVSLDYEKNKEMSDYYTKEEVVSFRKPSKKKKKKSSLRKKHDDDPEDVTMEVVAPAAPFAFSNKTISVADKNFVDDDELQSALSRVRKMNQKTKKSPEELAKLALEEESSSDDDNGGLVISETTEFVQNLDISAALQYEYKKPDEYLVSSESDDEPVVEQGRDQDDPMSVEEPVGLDDVEPEPTHAEPLVSSGLAATLALLNQKGMIDKVTEEDKQREKMLLERTKWLAEQKKRDVLKEIEKRKLKEQGSRKKGGKQDAWERQQEEREQERKNIQEAQDRYKDYVPDIKLVYKDDAGRELNSKEVS